MIMKMTRSTSRISISGTTFHIGNDSALTAQRDNTHESPRSSNFPCEAGAPISRKERLDERLLTGLELGGDEADLVDAGALHDIDGAGHVHKEDVVIALDERHLLRAFLKDLLHTRPQSFPGGVFVVDLEFSVLFNLDHHRLVLELLVLLLVGRGLRHQRIEPLRRQGRNNHEDDDEHEKNIYERHDIRRGQRAMTFSNFHPHCEFSY